MGGLFGLPYVSEVAACELGKLPGLDMAPVTIEREVERYHALRAEQGVKVLYP